MNTQRRTLQFLFLGVVILIPVVGLLRVDLTTGHFVVFKHYVLWEDFPLIFGGGGILIASLALTYTLWGNAFCGWACPQNTFCEFTDKFMHRVLGRKGSIGVDTADGSFAATTSGQRNRVGATAWVALVLAIASALAAAIILLYFVEPMEMVRQLTGTAEHPVDNFWVFYGLLFFVVFIDLLTIRHAWCRYLCPYKLMPVVFWNKRVMRLEFDEGRAEECKTCQMCNVSCFMYLDPRTPEAQDLCVDCGECITACEVVNAKRQRPALLKFYEGWFGWFGSVIEKLGGGDRLRVGAPLALLLLFSAMVAYGWSGYVPVDLKLSLEQNLADRGADGVVESQYRIRIRNLALEPRRYHLEVRGIPAETLSFSDNDVPAGPGQEFYVPLSVRLDPAQLSNGAHTLVVLLTSPDRPDIRLIGRATVVMEAASAEVMTTPGRFEGLAQDREREGEEE